MTNFNLKGQIEVTLLDENGSVKHREVQDNTITAPALRHMLYLMMSGSGLNNVSRATTGGTSVFSASYPTQFGLYVMSTPVDIRKSTYLPPYVDASRTGLHPNVTFYGVNGDSTETNAVIIPSNAKCYFNKGAEVEFSIEYVKNTATGIVRSVIIGRNHADKSYKYQLQLRDVDLPSNIYSSTVNYLLEHTVDGTILYKAISASEQCGVNLQTKIFNTFNNDPVYNNITGQFGGLIMNNTIFKVTKNTASGSLYKVNLTYVRNWMSSTAATSLTIEIPTREGMSVNTTVLPVLVAKPGTNKMEIFVTMSTGNHGGVQGANIKKVVVDVSNMDNITYTISDMGVIPYTISGYSTAVGYYMTGFFHDNKYYLPFYHILNPDTGGMTNPTTDAYQEGIILSSDFSTEHGIIPYRLAAAEFYAVVQADEILQCKVNAAQPTWQSISQVLSGANLAAPITKGANDVLRVTYRYRLT